MNKQIKTKEKKKKSCGKKIALIFLMLIIIIGIFLGYRVYKNGGGMQGILATAMGHNEETLKNLPKIYCLLVGQSQNLTDTIMVAEYSPQEQQASILSIPRDTYIGNDKNNVTAWDKINSVYQKSPERLLRKVNSLTGLDIKYYLKVDTKVFIKLVDAIGGVEFNVPIDMDYDDSTQDLHIHVKAGKQRLNGKMAEGVVRFRHNNDWSSYPIEYGDNDIGRMKTQRTFLMELAKQTLKIDNIKNINKFLDIAKECVETNLDFKVIKDYIPYIVKFNMSDLKSGYMPGTPKMLDGVSVYLADRSATKKMVNDLFLNPNDVNDKYNGESGEKIDTSNINKKDIKIEILDGTENGNRIEKLQNKLEHAGYIVKKVGKTNKTDKSVIIQRKSLEDVIKKEIQQITGISNFKEAGESSVTLTIIVGNDY